MTAQPNQPARPSAPGDSPESLLTFTVEARALPVSRVSRALRALQAALRESARREDARRRAPFAANTLPALLLDASPAPDGRLRFLLYFADPRDSAPMRELSERAFASFMAEFARELKALPQRGFWERGRLAQPPPRRKFQTELSRRLDDLYDELRHFDSASLECGGRGFVFARGRLEIEG